MRLAPALLLVLAAVALPQGAEPVSMKDPATEIKAARSYLDEVKKHLQHSFVQGDKLSDEVLVGACAEGFVKGLKGDAFAKVDDEVKQALTEAFQGDHESIPGLLSALKACLKDHDVKSFPVIRLADAGAKEMVAKTGDPFSRIFDAEEIQKLQKQLAGEEKDDAIGIGVENKDGRIYVSFVMYGSSAYEGGLLVGDEIVGVNGKAVKGMSDKELAAVAKAAPGSKVELSIRRKGWKGPIALTLDQRSNQHDEVLYEMLPGGIGYLRITMFPMPANLFGGRNAFPKVSRALKAMKKKGMKAIVLDLRHNPGGALQTVIPVADEFIGGDQLITKTETHLKLELPFKLPFNLPGMSPGDQDFTANTPTDFEEMPMVVLVNGCSASASELLSGALQDLHRATVVGETTYGKGIGQSAVPLFSTSSLLGGGRGVDWGTGASPFLPNRFLYLTVMRYYLPSGRSIHHKGVVPDVEVHLAQPDEGAFRALQALRASGAIGEYLDAAWEDHAEAFARIADYDDYSTGAYPGLSEFYRGLKTDLTEDQVRSAVREEARQRVARERKKPFLTDLEDDAQLQTGVLLLNDKLEGK